MICHNCRKEILDDSKFCTFCGEKLINVELQEDENKTQQQKTVKVEFHRLKKFVGCLVPMYIYVDKKLVATLKNDETKEMDITCGNHSVVVDMWSASSETKVEFSDEYTKMYIDIGIKTGLITNKAKIFEIRNEK